MEIMRSGEPPVFSRDKSDCVPDNLGKNCLLITIICLLSGALERKWESAHWVSRSPVSESIFRMYHI